MPERRPDVAKVVVLAADAHALLGGGGARIAARLAAEEHVLELVHAGVGEEERRVLMRHERRTGNDAGRVAFEKGKERRADLSGGHEAILAGRCRACFRLRQGYGGTSREARPTGRGAGEAGPASRGPAYFARPGLPHAPP